MGEDNSPDLALALQQRDALAEALRKILQGVWEAPGYRSGGETTITVDWDVVDELRAALALVDGKEG